MAISKKRVSFFLLYFAVNAYLPKLDCVNQTFINQILSDNKIVLNNTQVKKVKVPKFSVFNMRDTLKIIQQDVALQRFFPDLKDFERRPNRAFVYNVLNTIRPNYITACLDKAKADRVAEQELKGGVKEVSIT
jgi:hypothetical protein